MAGRGRGRGSISNKALTEHLGIHKSELIKEPIVGPPEIFPPMQFKPVKLKPERSSDMSYVVTVRKEFINIFRSSEYNISLDSTKPSIERYSDKFRCLSNKPALNLPWHRLPAELNPYNLSASKSKLKSPKKKRKLYKVNVSASKRLKTDDVEKKLEELEKKEGVNVKEEEVSEEEKEIIEEEAEDTDEEMDHGTDYVNNYFDNGEDYLEDENDALEDGGVF